MFLKKQVTFENKQAGVTLAGTLTLPNNNGPFPVALLISGMGPNDRDYTMLGHKLFVPITDHLVQNGIAVLSCDKRGVGQSTGVFSYSLTSKDLAQDVLAGVAYLKTVPEINPKQICLIGHSEGGMIGAMVAAQSPDVALLVSLAGATLTSVELAIQQTAAQLRADGATEDLILRDSEIRRIILSVAKTEPDVTRAAQKMGEALNQHWTALPEALKIEAEKQFFAFSKQKADGFVEMFNSPWYRFFLNYEPTETLSKITIPVLALNGDHDFISVSKLALPATTRALEQAKNKDYTVRELPHMNHWFQTCKTGSLAEYGQLTETMSPTVLNLITEWMKKRLGV